MWKKVHGYERKKSGNILSKGGLRLSKNKIILAITLSTLIVSACGVNKNGVNETAYRNRDINEPTRVNYPGPGFNYSQNGAPVTPIYNRLSDNNNPNVIGRNVNVTDNRTMKMRVADRVADKLVSMREIDRANVIVTDNNAYIGARLTDGRNLTGNLERKISDEVKAVDRDIDNVYVSVNPDFYDRMTNYSNDIRNGKPIEGFFDEFTQTVRRVFPNNVTR